MSLEITMLSIFYSRISNSIYAEVLNCFKINHTEIKANEISNRVRLDNIMWKAALQFIVSLNTNAFQILSIHLNIKHN
jgi:hypothetical protein